MKIADPALYKKIKSRCQVSEDDCWEWTQCTQSNGYGRINHKRKSQYVHRAMYLAVHGSLPKGKDICHKCDNRRCTNPDHLFAGTRKQNMEDCVAKGRQAKGMILSMQRRGERSPMAKLTQMQVDRIRARLADGESTKIIAGDFGVSADNIRRIHRFDTWRTGFVSLMPTKKTA